MAPRPSLARRTLAPQGEHIYELGVVGRKTGVTVPDTGVRDEHGMEPIENLFSSPGKSDPDDGEAEASDDFESGDEPMEITATKTLLKSPAQRNRLVARNSSSPARGAIVRGDGSGSSSQPTADQASTKRRLDFKTVANGGPHALSQPVGGSHYGGKGSANGHRLQPLDYSSEKDDGEGDEVNLFVEQSMVMLEADDYDLPQPESEASQSEAEDPPVPSSLKNPGRPPKQKAAASAKAASIRTHSAVDDDEGSDEQQEDDEQEDEEPTPRPQKPAPGRRGGPAKADKAPAPAQPPARGSKKRRSLDEDSAAEPSPEPQPKRQRAEPATTTTKKKPAAAAPKQPAASTKKPPPPAASSAPKPRSRKPKPSLDAADTSQLAIPRRPPLPKSRGLLINRREAPGDPGSSMHRTRSGRTSFKPLAYWRNERVEFDKDEAEDAFAGRTHKSKFVLPRLKEVVRVDEPEVERKAKTRGRKPGAGGGAGRRGVRRRRSGFDDDDDDDGGPAEVWELDPGTVTGEVVVWQPEYEFNPPAPNDLVSVMDKQLAISAAAIKTTEVVGGEFRYAKVFSEGFIGAGVVDLPPGAIKRLKNSRKVFMIFFVHAGRVLVTVQETSFRISKGGIFIVPRYNEYTIENDYDHPARIFFAQGQEMPVELPPQEDAAEDEEDVDEEVEVSEGEEEEEEEGSEED
ncbi:hypothetical protein NEMBOFW57_010223 [Staphylotrichum longicolle]|uniref:CENP-C homolog n=1 Tax=Staphylotrichum longicolle TaxID=669026 RepID=A0AAD4EQS5_9PEZI|nr:hypothetical protein NEMBOFW57_010223 [Staphylotrichum longicolle]